MLFCRDCRERVGNIEVDVLWFKCWVTVHFTFNSFIGKCLLLCWGGAGMGGGGGGGGGGQRW